METVKGVLHRLCTALKVVTETPALEADLMLAFVLNVPRARLRAYPETILSAASHEQVLALLARRLQGEPLAYLLGHREFWSREFEVNPSVLIPRPDTETLIETVLSTYPADHTPLRVLDMGTGSGILAITLQLERPHWEVHAVDISESACACASKNAHKFGCEAIVFHCGSWFNALPPLKFDVIVSNPPYLSEAEWPLFEAGLRYEPRHALVSGEAGLLDLRTLIEGAKTVLHPGGRLFLEHGYQQSNAVAALFTQAGYVAVSTVKDQGGQPRVTYARLTN